MVNPVSINQEEVTMAKSANIDKGSKNYSNHIREKFLFEKDMLVESVTTRKKDSKINPGAYNRRIQKGFKIEKEAAQFNEIGLGRLRPGRHELIPPFGVPVMEPKPIIRCELKQEFLENNAEYVLLNQDPTFLENDLGGKHCVSRVTVSALQNFDHFAMLENGFRTSLALPATNNPISIDLRSQIEANFNWVEVLTNIRELARVTAVSRFWVSSQNQIYSSPPVTLENINGNPNSHFLESFHRSAEFELSFTAPGASRVDVFETIFLTAIGDKISTIGGNFQWQPLEVKLTSGCITTHVPSYGYYGRL